MSTLTPVLAPADLTWAELQAARLDGDVYPLADGYCLLGEFESPRHRALAVLGPRSRRLIAELATAAWIWGAGPEPALPTLAVTPQARTRVAFDRRACLREVVYAADDIATLDGVRVTTPLRTAIELARQPVFDGNAAAAVSRLAAVAGFGIDDCRTALALRRGLPAKKRAAERLARALQAQAVETR